MNTIKIKTTELTGKALDWAVALAVCPESFRDSVNADGLPYWSEGWLRGGSPTTNWGQLGAYTNMISEVLGRGLGEGKGILVCVWDNEKQEEGAGFDWDFQVALCRAIVDLYLGDEVDVPEVLYDTNT